MPTGTKIAAIVLVVLLGAAGLYFAFVAPSTPHATDDHKESGPSSLNDSSNPLTLPPSGANANGLGTGTTPGATNPTGTATGMSNLEQLARNNANAGAGVGTTTGGVNTGVHTGTTTGTGSTVFPPSTTPNTTTPNTSTPNTGNGATAPAGSTVGSAGTPPTFNGIPRSGSSIPGGSLAAGGTNTGVNGGATTGNKSTPATGSSTDTASKPVVAKSNSDATKTTGEHTHIVTKGETFASIAKSELGSAGKWEMIAKANPNVKADALKIGTKLRIPSAASGTLAAGDGKIERSSGSTSAPGKALASNASTSGTTSSTTSGTTSHVVASGETMSSIAKAIYGNSKFWKAIAKANPTVDPDAMKAGQKLNIPSKTTVVGAENVEPASSR